MYTAPLVAEQDFFFPVVERKAFLGTKDGRFIEDPDHKYLARPGAAKQNEGYYGLVPSADPVILGLVGKNYSYFPNKELFGAMEEEISNAGADFSEVVVRRHMSYGGARCLSEYIFPKINAEPVVGDIVRLRLYAWNAFDGSMSFRVGGGAERLVCLNGLTSARDIDLTVRRHTSGTTIPKLVDRIKSYVQGFENDVKEYTRWSKIKVNDDQAKLQFSAIPNASERLIEGLVKEWNTQKRIYGANVWALYNTATWWASHDDDKVQRIRDTGNSTQAFSLYQREQRVKQWINSNGFKLLAA